METIKPYVISEQQRLTRAAAHEILIDVAAYWAHGWANMPSLHMLFAQKGQGDYAMPQPFTHGPEDVYWPFEDHGTVWLHRRCPHVKFMYEQKRPKGVEGPGNPDRCGAVGRTLTKPDGEQYTTYGGWTSNAGAINRFRASHPDSVEVLPEPIVEVTYHIGTWGNLGIAGTAWDLSFVQEALENHCPDVGLFPRDFPVDEKGNAEQSLVIYTGLEAPEAMATTFVPYPKESPYEKPKQGSPLDIRTGYDGKQTKCQRN